MNLQPAAKPRIVSLLPSLTEIVCKLGIRNQLTGRSHECDYPVSITELPVFTEPKYPETGDKKSGEINKSVLNLVKADPDILLVLPCGYMIDKTLQEMDVLTHLQGWDQLTAVKKNQIFIVDGHHYFNRPGPRITDSATILAEIFHPCLFAPEHRNTGWVQFKS